MCISVCNKYDNSTFLSHFQSIYISRLTDGGAADKDGSIQVGDRIVSVSRYNYSKKKNRQEIL